MNELLKLRGWASLAEAARYLSGALATDVSESWVLELALSGHLAISVNLSQGTLARCGRTVPIVDCPGAKNQSKILQGLLGQIVLSESEVLCLSTDFVRIQGVWDLAMVGDERLEIENRCRSLAPGAAVQQRNRGGILLRNMGGEWAQIAVRDVRPLPPLTREDELNPVPNRAGIEFTGPATTLPDGHELVVRVAALEEFETTRVGIARSGGTEPAPSTPTSGPFLPSHKEGLVGGPELAAWLSSHMTRLQLTVHRVHDLTGLDRKTIRRILDGGTVRPVRLQKLASGLSMPVSSLPRR